MNLSRKNSARCIFWGVLWWGATLLMACDAPSTNPPSTPQDAPVFHAMEIRDPQQSHPQAQDFRLKDAKGQERTLADWRGKAVLLFFGYVHCPDVCPTTLLRAAQAVALLGDNAERVQVLFVTLDPQRDTPEVLREYAPAFHPAFLGLYAAPEDTPKLARDFRVFYQINPGSTPNTYSIDHSVMTYVYDPQGRLRLSIGHDATPEEVAADIKKLLES
ncbi:MAG: SCO family protein [Zoogloeaceae bacterium]|nr:SCO family protein [Zoogloeaceae bacterium]